MSLVWFMILKFLAETAPIIGGASNSPHECPESEVHGIGGKRRTNFSFDKDTSNTMSLVWFMILKFLAKTAPIIGGTSKSPH
jgi:hypothetical protein